MVHVTLGELANAIMAQPDRSRVVALTAETTGNPALQALDLSLPQLFVSVQLPGVEHGTTAEKPAEVSLESLGLVGNIDLVMADPHHTYQASVAGVIDGLKLLRAGGVMLVHDCLPPPDLMDPEFQQGSWCGESYAAFRDVCRAFGLPWFTIDADFGIGVVGQPAANPGSSAAPPMPEHDPVRSQQDYLADPYQFMRAVAAKDAHVAIQRMASGDPVDDLVQEFRGWEYTEVPSAHAGVGSGRRGQPVDARTVIALLTRQNEILRGEAMELRRAANG